MFVTVIVEKSTKPPSFVVNVMFAMPSETGVTRPELSTVAIASLLLLQVPF